MDNSLAIVILAAGLGTRMKSKKPKVLHKAGGLALVEHVVDGALELAAPENVFVVVGNGAEQVRAVLQHRGVQFIPQEHQAGTGHALLVCRERLEGKYGRVLVLYGDCPLLQAATLRALRDAQVKSGAAATLITTLLPDPTGYGRILRDERGWVRAIVEEKAASPEQRAIREVNSGIYCFDGGVLWTHLARIRPDNPAAEYYLTDVVELLRQSGHAVEPMVLNDPAEVLGINTRLELAAVDSLLRERKTQQLMLDGVTIEKPETVTIDAGVRVGGDTVIEAFAQLLGRTEVGEDCRIGACSIVRDSALGNDVTVHPFTSIDSSRLDDGAHAGPYARIRMNAHLEAGAHVGNFVELKKTRLGARSKSMHLAYLGDSTIGAGVNIGAGTITCNYDGARKHPTTIGDGAFVGSNSTLVAPVEIGAGSYVAAGSVITKEVPADALAVARGQQANKPEWAARKRRERAAGHPQ
jgi:bifunctional UDP-N-acetylglucosamine pyrophosphorylase / glucosamine-1-phosphate N-acetyltransferase